MKKKRVTIKDIAQKTNVSIGTVDRVIHNRGKVAQEVKERVEAAIIELGYQRNLLASALAFNKVYNIVCIIPNPNGDLYWEQINSGIENGIKTVQHYGFNIEILYFDIFSPKSLKKVAKDILKKEIDGLLFPPLFLKESQWILKECDDKDIASIIINTNISDSKAKCYIGQDSYQSGVLAAQLLNFGLNGGETVVLLNLDYKTKAAQHLIEKEKGFRHYFNNISEKEIKVIQMSFDQFDDDEKLKKFIENMFKKHPKLKGIFVSNSRAFKIVKILDPKIFKNITIAGFDLIDHNLEFLYSNKIDFLINQNPTEQGFLGIMNFYKIIFKKEPVDKLQYLPLDIVVKENVQYYLNKQNLYF